MGGNIPGGNFLDGHFSGGEFSSVNLMGGNIPGGSFPGGIFLIPSGSSIICGWTWAPEDTSTQATSESIKCKQWMCRKLKQLHSLYDQLLGALIYLHFIILILICF